MVGFGKKKWHERTDISESIAVGAKSFVEKIKEKLGPQAIGRRAVEAADAYEFKEPEGTYTPHFGGKMGLLRPENTYFWNDFVEDSIR